MIAASTIDGKCITEVADWMRLDPEPVVSVVMITYNHEQFLSQAIDCVLAQVTDFPIELIIGEDCSTDRTREVALEYFRQYPELIRVRFPTRNMGANSNFISTVDAARGQYIAICEGDDYWCDKRKLQWQYDILNNEQELAGIFHDCYRLNDATGEVKVRIGSMKIDYAPDLESVIRVKHMATASMFYRKIEFTKRHKDLLGLTRKGDYMLTLIIAEQGRWKYLPKPMSVYRIHAGGVWSGDNAINICNADIFFYGLLLKDAIYSKYSRLIIQKRKNSVRQLAEEYAKIRKFSKSIFCFFLSMGPRSELGHYAVSGGKYWKVFFRELLAEIGFIGKLRTVKRRILL